MLTYGKDAIETLGFGTIKLYLTPGYATDYPGQNFGSVPTTLTTLAQTTPMAACLADAGFTRYLLTTYTFANGLNSPYNDLTSTNLSNEYTEVYNLAVHLLSTYSNKHFILQNAEGDWELLGGVVASAEVDPLRYTRFAAFQRVRLKAVRDAQAATASTSTVKLAIEMNRCLDDYGQRLWRDVLPLVHPDYVFLTVYESINTWGAQAYTEAQIETRLTSTINRIRRVLPNVPIVFSEFTWPQDEAQFTVHGMDVGDLIDKVIAVATSLGVAGCVWWQLFDNEEQSPGVPRGFGLYSRNGSSTTPGALTAAGTHLDGLV
jgi:hypothetical protein